MGTVSGISSASVATSVQPVAPTHTANFSVGNSNHSGKTPMMSRFAVMLLELLALEMFQEAMSKHKHSHLQAASSYQNTQTLTSSIPSTNSITA